MSGFKTELGITLVADRIWRLTTPLIYASDLVGVVIVPTGFETDLASVPRLPFIFDLWGSRVHREAVLHDYLYCYDCPIHALTCERANEVFFEAMTSRGVNQWIKYPMYWAVCAVGSWFFHRRLKSNFYREV